MTAIGGVIRYECPLPGCGWARDVLPAEGPWGVEVALREHADSHSALEYVRALLATRDPHAAPAPADRPLAVGDVLHGFCGGYFGRDHYDCTRIEAIGPDWVVTRRTDDDLGHVLGFASGTQTLLRLRQYRQQSDYCQADPCPVQPTREA